MTIEWSNVLDPNDWSVPSLRDLWKKTLIAEGLDRDLSRMERADAKRARKNQKRLNG